MKKKNMQQKCISTDISIQVEVKNFKGFLAIQLANSLVMFVEPTNFRWSLIKVIDLECITPHLAADPKVIFLRRARLTMLVNYQIRGNLEFPVLVDVLHVKE